MKARINPDKETSYLWRTNSEDQVTVSLLSYSPSSHSTNRSLQINEKFENLTVKIRYEQSHFEVITWLNSNWKSIRKVEMEMKTILLFQVIRHTYRLWPSAAQFSERWGSRTNNQRGRDRRNSARNPSTASFSSKWICTSKIRTMKIWIRTNA